jgi:hypothetical protein
MRLYPEDADSCQPPTGVSQTKQKLSTVKVKDIIHFHLKQTRRRIQNPARRRANKLEKRSRPSYTWRQSHPAYRVPGCELKHTILGTLQSP